MTAEQVPSQANEEIDVPAHKCRKKGKKDTSKYPHVIDIIPVAEEDRVCDCGCQKAVIRYEIKELFDYDIASIDATTLQVLDEPGRSACTKSYVYCLRGGPPDTPVILYGYNAREHKAFVDDWLEGFKGTIHMDASDIFAHLLADIDVNESYCNAHARRYFEKVKKRAKKQGLMLRLLLGMPSV